VYKHRQAGISRRGWRWLCLAQLQQLIHCYHSDDDDRPFTDHIRSWRRHPSTFCPSIAASASHRPTETAFLGALARFLHSSNLAPSLPYHQPAIATRTNRPPAQTILFLPLPAPILLPEIATAEPVTDHISPPQLHIHLCIHCRAPTALLLPQHSSCILPINTRFGFTPIGWVE
jgi:hypothetical protein